MDLAEATLLTPAWTEDDFGWYHLACTQVRAKDEDPAAVFCSESKLDPGARNPRNPKDWPLAVGLSQITRITAEQLGLTGYAGDVSVDINADPHKSERFAAWKTWADAQLKASIKDQLQTFVQYCQSSQWFKAGNSFDSATKLYQLNAAPNSMFLPNTPDTVIYPKGSSAFEYNQGLYILGKPSGITVGDLTAAVARQKLTPLYQAFMLRLNDAKSRPGPFG
jgi:hypothetical protein